MLLLVGLGNPGAKYAKNRHNIGFLALDRIAEDHGFLPWRARFQGQVAEGRLGTERATLLKPGTFMNLSGQSVGEAMRYLKLTPAEVIVFHDELDLAPGRVRVKTGGGHAGHNGLRSIHQHVGEAYGRVRIGIGHPGHKDRVSGYVLSDFAKAEEEMLDDLLRGLSEGAPALAAGDAARFQNAVAARVAPARNSGTARQEGAGGASADAGGKGPDTHAAATEGAAPAAKPPQEAPSFADRLRALGDKFRQT